jgi:sugar-specific transcriptional regulator TrmB
MSRELQKVLRNFDLSDGEAKTYLAALKLGKATAYEIAIEAGLKRPTVYVFLERLAEQGLVTKENAGAKTLILPTSPDRLIEIWRGRLSALEAIKPELDAFYQKNQYQPKVQVFEGERSVDAIYHELPPENSEGEEILLFGSMKAVQEGFAYLLPKWEKSFANKKNPIRELLNDEPENAAYLSRRSTLKNPNYQIRVMNGDVFGKTDNIIFGNKLAIFLLKEELFVTVIESEEIVKTYRALFNEAWKSAILVK